jgi:hypothetical protein
MSLKKSLLTLAALPLVLGGCSMLGPNSTPGTPGASASASPGPGGAGWIIGAQGSATPSPAVSRGGTPSPVLPAVSFLPVSKSCAQSWQMGVVLIPMTVASGKGSLTMTWPRQYDSYYRVTAVPQLLVSGNQPAFTWQTVPASHGCTVSATIGGLKSAKPYVVWLDAPATGYERDGTRHPYSGRSGVVYPR